MHIANGTARERALAGREAFELDHRERHHPVAQVAFGAALAGGAIIAAMIMGRRHERALDDEMYAVEFAEMHEPVAHQPKPLTSLLLPPLFIAMTLSGLRTWNAPSSPARTRALTIYKHGYRHRKVVQRRQGLWLHSTQRWLCGRVRPYLGRRALRPGFD